MTPNTRQTVDEIETTLILDVLGSGEQKPIQIDPIQESLIIEYYGRDSESDPKINSK